MKEFSKSEKLKAFIVPKMIDHITFIDNNGKSVVYTGGKNHWLYSYLETIGAPTKFTASGHIYHNFGLSSSINNYTSPLQKVIADLCMRQKTI